MSEFEVHPQLLQDCSVVGDTELCRVLLMNDARFPWLVLVPRVANLRDLHEVSRASREQLFADIEAASITVKTLIDADKINVAALGNQVPQLHVHVIGRLTSDDAWPGPVWGSGAPIAYSSEAQLERERAVFESMSLGVATD